MSQSLRAMICSQLFADKKPNDKAVAKSVLRGFKKFQAAGQPRVVWDSATQGTKDIGMRGAKKAVWEMKKNKAKERRGN